MTGCARWWGCRAHAIQAHVQRVVSYVQLLVNSSSDGKTGNHSWTCPHRKPMSKRLQGRAHGRRECISDRSMPPYTELAGVSQCFVVLRPGCLT
jgi:hypothetical protein